MVIKDDCSKEDDELVYKIQKFFEYSTTMLGVDLLKTIIPEDLDYNEVHNIAKEAKQKLSEIRPNSIGQAMRISGVNPADITMLMVYLKRNK